MNPDLIADILKYITLGVIVYVILDAMGMKSMGKLAVLLTVVMVVQMVLPVVFTPIAKVKKAKENIENKQGIINKIIHFGEKKE